MTVIEEPVNTFSIDEIFEGLSSLNRWAPWTRKLKKSLRDLAPWHFVKPPLLARHARWKYDKMPSNGRHGLSTAELNHWTPLMDALDTAQEWRGLMGASLVMTGSVEVNGLTLIGFDFDDVDIYFVPPFKTYAERSPSKVGVRMFAWVPTAWAVKFQDTLNCTPPHCEHAEIYIGTAPRFLTVTFDNINAYKIATLKGKDLLTIESWGLHLREDKPKATGANFDTTGKILDLSRFRLTPDQQKLVNGVEGIDRSETFMGLVINLLDHGASQEDTLATAVKEPKLMQYLLDHREGNADKAVEFAKKEITRAYPKSLPGKRQNLASFNDGWRDKPVTDNAPPSDLKFPMEVFDKAPGLVGEIAHWILGASYVPREEFAYAAALSTVACLVGPACTHGAGTRRGKLNMYLTLVGGTGTGKTEAMAGMGLLLAETDAKDCIMELPASEAALRKQLTLTPNVLLQIDELAHKLEGMKEGSNGSAMGGALLKGYDGGRMPPKVYADSKNSLPAVENPFVQVLGGTTDKVWGVVRASHLEDGTLNRFVFVCLVEDPDYRHNPKPDGTVPKALKDKLNTFWRAGKMADLVGDVPGAKFGRHISYEDDVEKALADLDKAMWKLQQGEFGNLYPRIAQNTMKIAAIIALGDGRESVAMRDFEQAQKFMQWSVANTHYKVSGNMASSWFEKKMKSVVRKLQNAPGRKLTMRSIYKDLGIKRRDADDVIDMLEAAGMATKTPPKEWTDDGSEWVWLL